MHSRLMTLLSVIAIATMSVDAIWARVGHFNIDTGIYVVLVPLVLLLMGGAVFYYRVRNELALGATFAAAAFLIVFPAACSLLSYLLLTVAGPRIDDLLASIDRSMGFSWPGLMAMAAQHRVVNELLMLAYLSVMPQTVVLLLLLGWKQRVADLYGLCFALAVGALVTISVWAIFPSFGAFSVFDLPPSVAAKLGLALGGDYGHELVQMLRHGPGRISPTDIKGIVGFPSYHTLQALALMWYARNIAFLRWPAVVLNLLVLMATPIQGGHHLIDMIGGVAVTVVAIALADRIVSAAAHEPAAAFSAASVSRPPQSAPI